MGYYRVEIFWRTKREAICDGMTVKAFDPDEAIDIAKDRVLKGRPARKYHGARVSEATPTDLKLGAVNE